MSRTVEVPRGCQALFISDQLIEQFSEWVSVRKRIEELDEVHGKKMDVQFVFTEQSGEWTVMTQYCPYE